MKIKNSDLPVALSGKMGEKVVARTRNGKTTFYTMKVSKKPPTAKQKANQERFAEAVVFARGVIADESLKSEYKQKARRKKKEGAYGMAISDYLRGS